MAKTRYRPRKEVRFWLYQDKAEEVRLTEYIDYLKQTRQFARMLKNGLRLVWSLGEGDTSVLYELFPSLRAQITPAPDTGALEGQIADLKRWIVEQGIVGVGDTHQKIMKPIAAPTLETKPAPLADAGTIADNFLAFIQ